MNLEATLEEIKKLDVSDRLWLAQAIWETIADGSVPSEPDDELKAELERRMADTRANPDKLLTLDELMARLDGKS